MAIPGSDEIPYGMFASQDIHKDDIIIERSPVLSICGLQLRKHLDLIDSLFGEAKTNSKSCTSDCFNYYGLLNKFGPKHSFLFCSHLYFCSRDCKHLAKQYCHDALCGVNILPIYSFLNNMKCYVRGPEISGMILLRLSATS